MHIGLYCATLPGRHAASGIVTYVQIMRQALMNAGHRVTVVTPSESQSDDLPPVSTTPVRSWRSRVRTRVASLRPPIGDSPGAGQAIAAHFANLHVCDPLDVIEMEESFGWSDTVARAMPLPVITRLHGPHLYGRDAVETVEKRRLSQRRILIEGKALARAAAITSPSARLLAATLADYRLMPDLVQVIPNPIALVPAEACWSAANSDPHQILHLGRFDSRKGADISISAFSSVLSTHPHLRLVLAGPDSGVTTPDGMLRRFDQYVRDYVNPLVRDRLTFLGHIAQPEGMALRCRSAVSLVPSRFENFAYSVAEAMSVGAPSIVSGSFGNVEMIENGISGWVVPVGDIAATADALRWMIDHPDDAAVMGARLRARCAEWLDPATVADHTVDFYERAIAARKAA